MIGEEEPVHNGILVWSTTPTPFSSALNLYTERDFMILLKSLFTSKLRYGLPLYGKIRWCDDDPKSKEFKDLQSNQKKMLRCISNSRISDRIS